jgi:hypothetical protein
MSENLPKGNAVSKIAGHWIEKYVHFFPPSLSARKFQDRGFSRNLIAYFHIL